jgi:hypothetical protein
MSNDAVPNFLQPTNRTVIYQNIISIENKLELPNQIISGILYNPDPVYSVRFTWQNTEGTLFSYTLFPRTKFKFNKVSLRSISNTSDKIQYSPTGNYNNNQLQYPPYQQTRSPLYLLYVTGNQDLPFDLKFQRSKNNKSEMMFTYSGTITGNFVFPYFPDTSYITYTMHITAVSGTSPSLQININPVSIMGSLLSGVNLYTKTYTAIGDDIQIINVNQLDQINFSAVVSGTTPSFTMELTVRG